MTEKMHRSRTITLGRYRHYKGNEYQVLGVATHSETLEPLVVYRPLYGKEAIWVRPYDMFVETIEIEERSLPRFELIEAATEVVQ